ncbi:MAG: YihY/virulence factor BrkB family protein [Spirochaetes bacterium]|nr:YihY/virulence factor BrkB family protein [Spirochaetota bacterium]
MKKSVLLSKARFLILKPLRAIKNFLIIDLRTVMKNFGEHDGELSTCALAFFLLISFIPLSLVIIAALSFIYDSDTLATFYITQLKSQLPSIDIGRFVSVIDRIIYKKRYLAFIWLPFIFWWGSFVFDIIERGLEKAFRIGESRRFWSAKIRHFTIIVGIAFVILGFTLLSNFIALLKNTGLALFMETHLNEVGILSTLVNVMENIPLALSAVMTLLMNTVLIFMLYRFIPPKKLSNKSLFKGALFASFSYEVVKSLFSYYIKEINDYTSIFGSLNTVVILMIWIWYTCFLFIIGAEMAWVFFEKSEKGKAIDFEGPAEGEIPPEK